MGGSAARLEEKPQALDREYVGATTESDRLSGTDQLAQRIGMSTFAPVATLADLSTLDELEILEGHGWIYAARDHHERPNTPEAMQLVHEVVDDRRAKAKKNER